MPRGVRGLLAAVVLAAGAMFRLWDGRAIEASEWLRHGDEYVVTLADGSVVILRQPEIREIVPRPGPGQRDLRPEPAAPNPRGPGRR